MALLAGIKVLDLSRVLAGPWATQLLADLGAEVIKVERPGSGDDTRGWGPPFATPPDGHGDKESAYFLAANRGKLGITVDFTTTRGQELIRELAKTSDVFIENFRVGQLAKYGLDYSSLAAINPRIVYCSITGYGQTGPYADKPGYDFILQGLGGLMSVTGLPDGEPGAGPLKVGVALTDVLTGLYASSAILAALRYRDLTGKGQNIDLALLDVQVATLANQALSYLVSGSSPLRFGNGHPSIVPYQTFATADDPINVAVGNDKQFEEFCQIVGRPELAEDTRFMKNRDRVQNRAELIPLLQDALSTRPAAHWIARFEAGCVPAGPINSLEKVFADPQIIDRGMKIEVPHSSLGAAPGLSCPIRFSETPIEYDRSAPVLGQDTRTILADRLGLSGAEIDDLSRDGVI